MLSRLLLLLAVLLPIAATTMHAQPVGRNRPDLKRAIVVDRHLYRGGCLTRNTPDTIPPTLRIIPPTNHAIVRDTATIHVETGDNIRVVGVRYHIGSTPLGPEVTVAPFSFFWDARTWPEGPIELTAVARDEANNLTIATTNVWIMHNDVLSIEKNGSTGARRNLR